MKLSIKQGKNLLYFAMIMLVVNGVYSIFENLYVFLSGLIVAGAYVYFGRKARQKALPTIYFLLPPILFTFVPLAYSIAGSDNNNFSLIEFIINNHQYIVGLILPLISILIVYNKIDTLSD